MEIKRNRYLERLISRMNNGMIKVVTGIRRCGKTYLLFHLFYDYLVQSGVPEDNIITVPLDDDDYAEYTDPGRLYDYIEPDNSVQDPLIFCNSGHYMKDFIYLCTEIDIITRNMYSIKL